MAGRAKKPQAQTSRWRFVPRIRALRALWRPALSLTLAAGLLASAEGCSRWFFRNKADEEVSEVLAQKDKYPAWKIDNWWIYPHPLARFADPSNPDRPPMPPDDPAAYNLSPNPQHPGKAGVERIEGNGYLELIAQWDKENREKRAEEGNKPSIPEIEPPVPEEQEMGPPDLRTVARALAKKGPAFEQDAAFGKASPTGPMQDGPMLKAPPQGDAIAEAKARSLLDITGRPTYLLTLDQAAELAMFNSREYQDQRENLYLAALPVTTERFAFMAQFFAAQEAIRAYSGRETVEGQRSNWTLNNGTGFSKILPTGALLLLNFSNQTVFDFLNPKRTTSVTNLNFNAIQPLLRGGGKAVALEPLTQSERNLLYQIRNFARFRKSLYVAIASNNGGAISGSSFQPVGVLSGNNFSVTSGLGSSGIVVGENVGVPITINGARVPPPSPGVQALTAAITPPPSGYLSTMLQKIQVYIDQENIDVLSDILQRFRGLLEGDVVQPLQVQSVEQQLLSGRATLLSDQTQYLQSLDAFKLSIGVPMKLSIEMDDTTLRPLMNQFRKARAIIDNEHAAVREASSLIAIEKAPDLRAELLRLFTTSQLVKGTAFAKTIRGRWEEWEKMPPDELDARLKKLDEEAKELLKREADLQEKGQQLSPADQERLRAVNRQRDLGGFESALRKYEAAYVKDGKPVKPADPAGERQRIRQFQTVVSLWQKVLVEARDDQWAAVRASWPELPRCCVDGVDLIKEDLGHAQAAGGQHALENRFDLMNVRAQVVDSWRQLAVYANALLGTFTVQYNLNASSPVGMAQPLNIGGSGNTHQLILNTELPLTRILERNNYRASLIAFQRQRRTLQEAEDLAVQAVYGELYVLRQLAESYRLQQRQLELAYLTIDNSLEALEAPTPPAPPPGLTRGTADGPAALTTQLLNAQRSLPTAQNALLTVWINYLNTRLQLYRDLELMPLDARGVWIDEIRDCDCGVNGGQPLPAPLPEMLPPPSPAMK